MRRVLLLLLLLVAGCVPYPHYQRRAPEFVGVVRREGAPLPGLDVRLHVNPPWRAPRSCEGTTRARTDAEGRFRFEETKEFEFFILMGDRRDAWAVCFELPEGGRAVWSGHGWWGGPQRQELSCEVGAAPPDALVALPSLAEGQPGVGCAAR